MKTWWGDLHNHCAISYGQGTARRALDNARRHLDFCTLTGHAFWPDLPMDLRTQNSIIGMHLGGFAKLQHYWPEVLAELRRACRPGRFVTLPSYEWHSMEFGDYNCYAPRFDLELLNAPNLPQLAARLKRRRKEFFLLPHHCAYPRGYRGTQWDHFDASVSPLVEIYSNHGCGEADDAPYDYYHSMGPRTGESFVRQALARGHRFGFYASTDSHDGYPGHYGHGKVGALADRLDLDCIWSALKARRTIASTGARIRVEVDAGDGGIGEVLKTGRRDIRMRIEGSAPIEAVDWIEGGEGSWRVRRLPAPAIEPDSRAGRYKLKIEAGWGRAGQLSNWDISGRLIGARLTDVEPCFRFSSGKGDETSSENLQWDPNGKFSWQGQALPNPAGAMGGSHFSAGGTQAVVLDLQAGRAARLRLKVNGQTHDFPLRQLAEGSSAHPVGGFGSAAFKVHRCIPEREFSCNAHLADYQPFRPGGGFGYLRVRQADGHTAWVSPLWFE